uniref:Uncharacterized protein n=1 Tax=Sinocyclocheilus anshuiensis TaxID=1608454 RepID=A0A671RHV9_9TELE
MADPRIRQIKIKTGVVKRTVRPRIYRAADGQYGKLKSRPGWLNGKKAE